jgi:hypothetical protein
MEAAARLVQSDLPGAVFEDGLGQRFRSAASSEMPAREVLVLRPAFTLVPSFEFALRERTERLESFRHACYARVRGIERRAGIEPTLEIVSDAGQGIRISELLAGAQAQRIPIDIHAALWLIRQLVSAVAALHETRRDIAHGAIAPERIMVRPPGRVLIVDHVLGAALEQLRYSRHRYWTELRVPLPPGDLRFDHRADVLQVGMVALSLILGRALRPEEFPERIGDVVASAWAVSPQGGFEPLPPGLRGWLARTLQIDAHRSFPSALEGRAELDAVLGDTELLASPSSLEAFLTRLHAAHSATALSAVAASAAASPLQRAAFAVAPVREDVPDIIALATPLQSSEDRGGISAADCSVSHDENFPAAGAEDAAEGMEAATPRWSGRKVAGVAGALVLAAVTGWLLTRRPGPPPGNAASGTLELSTSPSDVIAVIDGQPRGATPLTIALDPGAHTVELRGPGEPKTISITISPGMKVSQYVELGREADPAEEALDGVRPVNLPLSPIQPVETGAPAPPSPVENGTVLVQSAVDIQVFDSGAFVGSGAEPLVMRPGRHELELLNRDLGIRQPAVVEVVAGRNSIVSPSLPNGTLSLNAIPWAEVWIDGERVGETPIGNVALRVGSHDIVFRHPELGERRQTIVVTAVEPGRLSVDLRQK